MSYLSPTDCLLCYTQSRVKLPHCLPADSGCIYLDGCFLSYGGDNFTAAATDASDTAVCSNATAPARCHTPWLSAIAGT
jgi:ornithine carbamoyltransferase